MGPSTKVPCNAVPTVLVLIGTNTHWSKVYGPWSIRPTPSSAELLAESEPLTCVAPRDHRSCARLVMTVSNIQSRLVSIGTKPPITLLSRRHIGVTQVKDV